MSNNSCVLRQKDSHSIESLRSLSTKLVGCHDVNGELVLGECIDRLYLQIFKRILTADREALFIQHVECSQSCRAYLGH